MVKGLKNKALEEMLGMGMFRLDQRRLRSLSALKGCPLKDGNAMFSCAPEGRTRSGGGRKCHQVSADLR